MTATAKKTEVKKKPNHNPNHRQKRDAEKQRAVIALRVAPERKKFTRRKNYKEGSPGFERAKLGVTLAAIKKSINEPFVEVTVLLDGEGNPTGESASVSIAPDHATKALRRDSFVQRGLLAPFPDNTKRRYERRRNSRYAAVGTKGKLPPKKTWHRSSKSAAPAEPSKKVVRR